MKFDEFNYRGLTTPDNMILRKYLKKNLELTIDDAGRVYTESGKYIADAVQDEENGIGIAIQNEKPRGGARKNAGRKKIAPADAKVRGIKMTDKEHAAVKKLLEKMRK